MGYVCGQHGCRTQSAKRKPPSAIRRRERALIRSQQDQNCVVACGAITGSATGITHKRTPLNGEV
jgi:hypothetical protein